MTRLTKLSRSVAAHATLSLLLPAASYITGAVLAVDGELTVRNA